MLTPVRKSTTRRCVLAYDFTTPPSITQKAPFPAQAMHVRTCKSSSLFLSDMLALLLCTVSRPFLGVFLRTAAWVWGGPRSPFNVLRLSGPRHSPIYSTLPRTTVIRPAVRCQATSRNEIKLEGVNGGPIKCIHLAPSTACFGTQGL